MDLTAFENEVNNLRDSLARLKKLTGNELKSVWYWEPTQNTTIEVSPNIIGKLPGLEVQGWDGKIHLSAKLCGNIRVFCVLNGEIAEQLSDYSMLRRC
jgi:hypothetical protein